MENLCWGGGSTSHALQNALCVLAGSINCAVSVVTELQLEYFTFGSIANIGVI